MKPFVLCAALTLTTVSALTAFAQQDAASDVKPKPKKKAAKPAKAVEPAPEKVTPTTEAAAPKSPEAAPVALETLPPVAVAPAPPPAAPAPAAPPPSNPDTQPSDTASSTSSTRLEAVAGRTQSLGFALGFRMGHRMNSNVYVGGTAMVQTGVKGGFLTYPAMELGYDAKLAGARFMPYFGVGPMFVVPTAVAAPIQVAPVVYPGFALRYENDKSAFTAGADVRFLYFTETDNSAFAFNMTVGLKF